MSPRHVRGPAITYTPPLSLAAEPTESDRERHESCPRPALNASGCATDARCHVDHSKPEECTQ